MSHTPKPWKWRNGDELRSLHDKGRFSYGSLVLGLGNDGDGGYEIHCNTENRDLIEAAPDLLAFAKAVEAWESKLLSTDEAWLDGMPRFTDELYQSWMELQKQRNAVLKKARGGDE